jgi:hypothetical protein
MFFLIEFKDFLSCDYFRYNIIIGCLEYKDYFRYIFEHKTSYVCNTKRYLVYNSIS